MKFTRQQYKNLALLIIVAIMIIPSTRLPIQIFIQKMIAGAPDAIEQNDQVKLKEGNWTLVDITDVSKQVTVTATAPRVRFVSFWATWCPPCIAELPSLQKLYDAYGDRVDFYMVTNEKPEVVQAFLKDKGYTMPVYSPRSRALQPLTYDAIPTNFLIDMDGSILIEETGAQDWYDKDFLKYLETTIDVK